jgi:GNAT superfamily N-acetyltransferase
MDAPGDLPVGLTARGLTDDDIDVVVALANACELHDVGFTMWERADLASDFRLDTVEVASDTMGIWDGGSLVGWAFLPNERGAWVDVHPDARGRGIGTWLRRWTEGRARERRADRIGQTINDRVEGALRLLRDAGYTARRESWILTMEHAERPAAPVLPDGVSLRPFRPGDEDEALRMFEDAFSEIRDRAPSTFETWRAKTIERDGFEPEDLILAEREGEIVGGAFLIDSEEVWVDKFATRADHRHRGIARALLQAAFQRSFDRGYGVTSLSTDSTGGARPFYEKVGMHVKESYTHLALDL